MTAATVSAAESVTGGAVCAALSQQPGSSRTFLGGVVAYTVPAKIRLLGLDPELLAAVGPVHPHVAAGMAGAVARLTGSAVAVSTTGVAGPEPHGGHPPGYALVGWTAAAGAGVLAVTASGDRGEVRAAVTRVALAVVAQCTTSGQVRDVTALGRGVVIVP